MKAIPVITVQLTEGKSVTQKRELVRSFTEEFCRICDVQPNVVTIVLQEIPNEHWTMGGKTKAQTLEEKGLRA